MARELAVKVVVESDEASRKLSLVDKQTESVGKSFEKTGLQSTSAVRNLDSAVTKLGANGTASFKSLTSSIGNLTSVALTASGVFTGMIGAQVIGAAISFGRSLIDDASALSDLSAKTGVGVEGLQRLREAASESGNSLDQVTRAISQFQNRVAEGNKEAVGSLQALGLSVEEIRRLNPDEQFIEIAKAIAQIPDPLERTRIAMDLFGRAGADILPTLTSDIKEITEATKTLDKESIEALDRAGDAWQRFVTNVKVSIAQALLPTTQAEIDRLNTLSDIADGLRLPDLPKAPGLPIGAAASALGLPSAQELKEIDAQLAKVIERTKALDTERRKEAAYIETLRKAARDKELLELFKTPLLESRQTTSFFGQLASGQTSQLTLVSTVFTGWAEKLQDVGNKTRGLGEEMDKIREKAKDFGLDERLAATDHLLNGINSTFAQTAELGIRAFRDIRNYWEISAGQMKRTANTVGVAITDSLAAAAAMINPNKHPEAAGALAGAATGAGVGFMFGGPYGAAIGAGIGAIAGYIGSLGRAEKDTNDLRDSIQELTFKDLDSMNRAFDNVGLTLDRVLSAKTTKDLQLAFGEFEQKLKAQQNAYAGVEAAAKKYNITIEEMGHAWQQNQSDMKASELLQDWTLLVNAGANADIVITKMSKSINDFLHKAMTLGTEVPAAMKPMIEDMIRLGLLTDASGKKVETLEDSGIKFAETMSEGFQKVVDSIHEMTEALRIFLGLAPKPSQTKPQTPAAPAPSPPATTGNENPNGITYHPGQEEGYTYHRGGVVLPFIPRAHNGMYLAPDERMIVAQTGEGVLSRRGLVAIGGEYALKQANAGQTPMPPKGRRRILDEEGNYTGTPIDPNYEWKTMRRTQPVHIDARGAVFGTGAPEQITRMVSEQLSRGGPDSTRFRGSARVR